MKPVEEQEEIVQNGNKKKENRTKMGKNISDAFKINAQDDKDAKEETEDKGFKNSEKGEESLVSSCLSFIYTNYIHVAKD